MILAREILTGDRLKLGYLFGIRVVSVAWIGSEVWVRDHMGGGWVFGREDWVFCLQRWNGAPS